MDDGGTFVSPLTTKGDLFGFSTTNAKIAIGTNGKVLTADSSAATGVSWKPTGNAAGTATGQGSGGGAASQCGDEFFTYVPTTANAVAYLKGSATISSPATIETLHQYSVNTETDNLTSFGFADIALGTMPEVNGDGFNIEQTTHRIRCTNDGTSTTGAVTLHPNSKVWVKFVWTSATSVVFSEQSPTTGQYVALGTLSTNVPNSTTMTLYDWQFNDTNPVASANLHTIFKVLIS